MKKNRYALVIALLTGALLGGCGTTPLPSSTASPSASGASVSQSSGTPASTVSPTGSADDSETTETITITIVNFCGADIGMFSVIDPGTGEQLNVGSLDSEASLTLNDWPKSVTAFQWAVYNNEGQLYQEANTDISAATTGVSIVLKGDGAIEDVETSFR